MKAESEIEKSEQRIQNKKVDKLNVLKTNKKVISFRCVVSGKLRSPYTNGLTYNENLLTTKPNAATQNA